MRNDSRRWTGTKMAVLIILWGLTATAEAVALRGLTPYQFTAWSTFFGAAGATLLSLLTGQGRRLISFSASDHAWLFPLSLIGFGLYFVLKYTAFSLSPIPQANVLQYTFTIFIVILAVPLMKQPLTAGKLAGVAVGFTGAAVVMTGGRISDVATAHLPGYICALAAGVSFALFSVLSHRSGHYGLPELAFFHGYSAIFLMGALAIRGEFAVPATLTEIGGVLYSGVASNVLGMYLWLTLQKESKDVSILTGLLYFVPFVSLVCLRFFLGLPTPANTWFGLALIVGGLLIHGVRDNRRRE